MDGRSFSPEDHLDDPPPRPAMGISGLLPLLKSIHKNKHLSEFAGKTVAVDAYVWLHKGVYACAPEVATGKRTTKYVVLPSHRIPTNSRRVVRRTDTLNILCTAFGYYATTRSHRTSFSMEDLYQQKRPQNLSGRRGETRTWPRQTSWRRWGNMHKPESTMSNALT